MWITPLGPPVEPDVNNTTDTSPGSASTPSTGGASSSASNPPSPRTSMQPATFDDAEPAAASTTSGETWSHMTATSASAARWWIGAAIAPRRQQARYSAIVSHQLGVWNDTTSPRPTPSRRSPPARRRQRSVISPPVRRRSPSTTVTRSTTPSESATDSNSASIVGWSSSPGYRWRSSCRQVGETFIRSFERSTLATRWSSRAPRSSRRSSAAPRSCRPRRTVPGCRGRRARAGTRG